MRPQLAGMKYAARKAAFAVAFIFVVWVLVFWVVLFLHSGITTDFGMTVEEYRLHRPNAAVTAYDGFFVIHAWRHSHPVLTLWLVLTELVIILLAAFGAVQMARWWLRRHKERVEGGR